jgi:hypothetical protein
VDISDLIKFNSKKIDFRKRIKTLDVKTVDNLNLKKDDFFIDKNYFSY